MSECHGPSCRLREANEKGTPLGCFYNKMTHVFLYKSPSPSLVCLSPHRAVDIALVILYLKILYYFRRVPPSTAKDLHFQESNRGERKRGCCGGFPKNMTVNQLQIFCAVSTPTNPTNDNHKAKVYQPGTF